MIGEKVRVVDLVVLAEYFSKLEHPTEEDQARHKKIHESLCHCVDGIKNHDAKQCIEEIYENLTGNKFPS